MKHKLLYQEPSMELLVLSTQDVITTSGGWEGDEDPLILTEIGLCDG